MNRMIQLSSNFIWRNIYNLMHKNFLVISRFGFVILLYALYLPFTNYTELYFDAGQYWNLAFKFFSPSQQFSILNYNESMRGYLAPFMLLPVRVLSHAMSWNPIVGARVMGVLWAALLFGVAIPIVWKQAVGRQLRNGAWLLIVALGFIFWRDYFNFPLQDVPALTLLLLALAAATQRGLGWVMLAGALLAATLNLRPLYLASIPGFLGWLYWQTRYHAKSKLQTSEPQPTKHLVLVMVVLTIGAAIILLPQLLINYRHFHQVSPLVLTLDNSSMSLYLKQLNWGMAYQRYESSISPNHFGGILYADAIGLQQLQGQPGGYFSSYTQYINHAVQHPLSMITRLLRHLFNGMDLWFATPYPHELQPASKSILQLLNYSLISIGIWQLGSWFLLTPSEECRKYGIAWLLFAILLPVALTLPTLVESRFLLPLHILLITVTAANFHPLQWLRLPPKRQLLLAALFVLSIWVAWDISSSTVQQLLPYGTKPPTY